MVVVLHYENTCLFFHMNLDIRFVTAEHSGFRSSYFFFRSTSDESLGTGSHVSDDFRHPHPHPLAPPSSTNQFLSFPTGVSPVGLDVQPYESDGILLVDPPPQGLWTTSQNTTHGFWKRKGTEVSSPMPVGDIGLVLCWHGVTFCAAQVFSLVPGCWLRGKRVVGGAGRNITAHAVAIFCCWWSSVANITLNWYLIWMDKLGLWMMLHWHSWGNRQFKHQTLFATQTQTQRNLIVKANQMCRISHTLISHWPKNLGFVGFEFALQLTFGA